jgi:hypothetical protein
MSGCSPGARTPPQQSFRGTSPHLLCLCSSSVPHPKPCTHSKHPRRTTPSHAPTANIPHSTITRTSTRTAPSTPRQVSCSCSCSKLTSNSLLDHSCVVCCCCYWCRLCCFAAKCPVSVCACAGAGHTLRLPVAHNHLSKLHKQQQEGQCSTPQHRGAQPCGLHRSAQLGSTTTA